MTVAIQSPKSSRIRAQAAARPELDHHALARLLGFSANDVRVALANDPKLRKKSVAR